MFCPGCGSKENHSNQFCRACGTELRIVRSILEKPDNITSSAMSAREEIGKAIATKIRETQSVEELKSVTEKVLPDIEKFLESPSEKRLRRIRNGTTVSSIGLGVCLMFLMMSTGSNSVFMTGLGLVTFFIGLGTIINGLLFTIPKKKFSDKSIEAQNQKEFDELNNNSKELLMPPIAQTEFSSVTEHTTKHLRTKKPISNR